MFSPQTLLLARQDCWGVILIRQSQLGVSYCKGEWFEKRLITSFSNRNPCKHKGGKHGFSRGTIVLDLGRACKLLFLSRPRYFLGEVDLDATLISSRPNFLIINIRTCPADFYCQKLLDTVHKMHNVGNYIVDLATVALTGIELVTKMIDQAKAFADV